MADLTVSYTNLRNLTDTTEALKPSDSYEGTFTVNHENNTDDPVDSTAHLYVEIMKKDGTVTKLQDITLATVTVPPHGTIPQDYNFSVPLSDIITNENFYLRIEKATNYTIYLESSVKFDILPNLLYIKSHLENDWSTNIVTGLKSAFRNAPLYGYDLEYVGNKNRQGNFIGYGYPDDLYNSIHFDLKSIDCSDPPEVYNGSIIDVSSNHATITNTKGGTWGMGYMWFEKDSSSGNICSLKSEGVSDSYWRGDSSLGYMADDSSNFLSFLIWVRGDTLSTTWDYNVELFSIYDLVGTRIVHCYLEYDGEYHGDVVVYGYYIYLWNVQYTPYDPGDPVHYSYTRSQQLDPIIMTPYTSTGSIEVPTLIRVIVPIDYYNEVSGGLTVYARNQYGSSTPSNYSIGHSSILNPNTQFSQVRLDGNVNNTSFRNGLKFISGIVSPEDVDKIYDKEKYSYGIS